ncbi:electron transfer flavoprotein subunit beta/FixA family protein [Kushneria phosphatilytica]|uniref:Electron transfer flavoprotein subunit beta n=1 Tax=Kushneria phosphatilytica TaxID=657387 RepID=A0A1S1P016_9GAMM|nr:electron transfer flavoprotein subunit beta/FixA family protein [Kushneria phosphatilytica]OHV11815.1 electron transfer flavoprotein subunit beta [Kushneria phosphatilytica]QEL10980.1 electron transfer flavoprotein subunit beta/FixA family protein [Kushneria phosphatilytica]
MKVLVAVKRVIDYNVRVRISEDHSDVDLAHAKMAMNPFCEIALEEAVRLKEQGIASEVVAVSIGPKSAQEQLRAAMALGADRALHLEHETALDSLHVAKLLAKLAEEEQPGLVLLGKQSIDSDNNQTAQMLAALMGTGQATYASEVRIEGESVTVTREIDGGLQTLALQLPAVISADLRLNEPRFARLPDIMKAKKRPIESREASSLGIDLTPRVRTLHVDYPAERQPGVRVASVDELVDRLKNEAGVL